MGVKAPAEKNFRRARIKPGRRICEHVLGEHSWSIAE